MHTGTLKKMALALTFWLALHTSSLKAQILPLGPYGTSPTTFEVDANGLLSATGTYGGTDSLSLSGAGARMFWDPYKAAFRAGYVNGTQWNDSNIGNYSVAFGYNTIASGYYSRAFGENTTASGNCSTAFGENTTASGSYATAFGYSSTASGTNSTASGYDTLASGLRSVAFGGGTDALGQSSFAFGAATRASGNFSAAAGINTTATAYDSFVAGYLNLGTNSSGGTASATTWVATDPLFEIGNGTQLQVSPYTLIEADALVVYKNGNATVQGNVTAPSFITTSASGDIPMYTGN